jgi:hypothetical protein
MIEKRTVFILGAGASCPYGFPTAIGLRGRIIGGFVRAYEHLLNKRQKLGVDGVNEGYPSPAEAKRFVSCFDVSSTESIDLFLSRHPQFEKIGKIAIALTILDAEQSSQFRERARANEDWYFHLFNRLTRELAGRDGYQEFGNSSVAFVTFNYDRSLEYFLFNSLLHAFEGADPLKIEEQILRIPIIHVYGQIAPVKLYDDNGERLRAYGLEYGRDTGPFSAVNFLNVIDYLYVVREERANPELEKAHEQIAKAERLFFLGFGYARENLAALGIPGVLRSNQYIHGTAMGYIPAEVQRIENALGQALGASEKDRPNRIRQVHIRPCDCLGLLRESL